MISSSSPGVGDSMNGSRSRLLSLAAVALAALLDTGCTYYTLNVQTTRSARVTGVGIGTMRSDCSVCGAHAGAIIGYEVYDSQRLELVQYVHVSSTAVERYPRVMWAGRAYYNIEGHLVFYSPEVRGWVYYWTPPSPLIVLWNGAYPDRQYVWGDGSTRVTCGSSARRTPRPTSMSRSRPRTRPWSWRRSLDNRRCRE